MSKPLLLTSLFPIALAGCQSPPDLPTGPAAYQIIPARSPDQPLRPYQISPMDVLAVNVFRTPDLSFENVQVDSSGAILFPLLGEVQAAGQTPTQLANELAARLRPYLENPQVTIFVKEASSQRVTVLGSVTQAGIYELEGASTLLDALALARGLDRVAKQEQVIVFRNINGRRMAAMFNVRAIQRGEADDPEILGNDTVVVGLNHIEAAWRDVLLAAPLANVFIPLYN